VTLADTIERWRNERDVVLAEQIDVLAESVAPMLMPPPKRMQRWWLAQAKTYDPEVATTLLAQLRAYANDDQLADRIRAMLRWPDDPRVGVALAETLVGRPFNELYRMMHRRRLANPFVDEIAKRIVEIGDARGIERLASLWNLLGDETRNRLANVQLREPKYKRASVPLVDTAWAAVLAEPLAIQPRLVLGDAYLQSGDPRGEVIATQCVPLLAIEQARARGEAIDPNALFGVRASEMTKLIDANWHRWLGDVAMVVARGSKFRGGLLSDIWVGHAATPVGWAWQRAAHHRELCAVEHVRYTDWVRPKTFVEFVAKLASIPRWIHLDDRVASELRGSGVRAQGVMIHTHTHGQPALRLARIVDTVIDALPKVERIGIDYLAAHDLADVREVAARLSIPLYFTVSWRPTIEERYILDELRAMPHVRISSYGDL
jgi:hypothetical protein